MRFYICFFYRFSSQLLALNSEQYGTLANAYFLNSIKVRRDTQFLTPSLWEGWGGFRGYVWYYTLNLKCMMSPSCTTYSLPSIPSLPASLTAVSEPYLM